VYQSLITYAPKERERGTERKGDKKGGTDRLGERDCEKVRERNN
jgi:hypothetical protein